MLKNWSNSLEIEMLHKVFLLQVFPLVYVELPYPHMYRPHLCIGCTLIFGDIFWKKSNLVISQ